MNAPAQFPTKAERIATAVNKALAQNQKADAVIALLTDYKRFTIDAARGDLAGEYHMLVTQYDLGKRLSDLLGTDDLNELADNAAHDLAHDHSYDIIECCDLDRNGDPVRQRRSGE